MKIEYSIISPVENEYPAKLTFKLILDGDDWLLLNQFKPSKFKSIISRNSDNYSNLKKSALNPDSKVMITPEFALVCSWGKGQVFKGKDNDGNTIWETTKYKLKSESEDGQHFKIMIDEFIKQISKIMKSALNEVGELDYNCWKKTDDIIYRD